MGRIMVLIVLVIMDIMVKVPTLLIAVTTARIAARITVFMDLVIMVIDQARTLTIVVTTVRRVGRITA